jgi:hypothetical protein
VGKPIDARGPYPREAAFPNLVGRCDLVRFVGVDNGGQLRRTCRPSVKGGRLGEVTVLGCHRVKWMAPFLIDVMVASIICGKRVGARASAIVFCR